LKQQRPDQSVFSDIKNTELELKSWDCFEN